MRTAHHLLMRASQEGERGEGRGEKHAPLIL